VPDPYDLQSLNRASYVRNNPLRYTDPTGFAEKQGDHVPPKDPGGNHHAEFGSSICQIEGHCDVEGVGVLKIATPVDDGESDKKKTAPSKPAGAPAVAVAKDAKPFSLGVRPFVDNLIDSGVEAAGYNPLAMGFGAVGKGFASFIPDSTFELALAAFPAVGKIGTLVEATEALSVAAKGVATIDTAAVRFTQDSVKGAFRNGTSLNEAAAALRAGGAEAASKFPAIRLVEHEGQLFTLDNRRLLTFSQAGQRVPFRMATEAEIAREWASKFTTTEAQGWGQFITVRP
jgi:hypothetical protein